MNTWQAMWNAVANDFSDLDPPQAARVGVRLLLAALLGGAIGFERQRKGKPAGLRTHMLVSLGAALFVIAIHPVQASDSAARVIQGVAAGIGFLGAGAILKDSRDTVYGLTTAAGIWLTAAVGATAGMGRDATALLATILALVILSFLPRFEHWSNPLAPKPHDNSAPRPE